MVIKLTQNEKRRLKFAHGEAADLQVTSATLNKPRKSLLVVSFELRSLFYT